MAFDVSDFKVDWRIPKMPDDKLLEELIRLVRYAFESDLMNPEWQRDACNVFATFGIEMDEK